EAELGPSPGEVDVYIIDEIGKMECLSPAFVRAVRRVLDGTVPVLATVALKGGGFIGEVKARTDVGLVEVSPANRDGLPAQVATGLGSKGEGVSEGRGTMLTVDREQVAAAWAARGFSCDVWVDPPGWRWEEFTHATDELVLVLEGAMEFEVEGRVARPALGEEWLIPAGARHSPRNGGGTPARRVYAHRRRGGAAEPAARPRQGIADAAPSGRR